MLPNVHLPRDYLGDIMIIILGTCIIIKNAVIGVQAQFPQNETF